MGCFRILVMVGYKIPMEYGCLCPNVDLYLFDAKTAYNNHYYLMMLLCWLMVFFSANRYLSLDALKPGFKSMTCPLGFMAFIPQIWIVFTYASIAKMYPHWWDASAPALSCRAKRHWLMGGFLQQPLGSLLHRLFWSIFRPAHHHPHAPLKRTRLLGFGLSLFFTFSIPSSFKWVFFLLEHCICVFFLLPKHSIKQTL